MDGFVLFGLLLFQLGIKVRAQFGVFRLDIDGHSEDAAGIDETFGEDAEDGFRSARFLLFLFSYFRDELRVKRDEKRRTRNEGGGSVFC